MANHQLIAGLVAKLPPEGHKFTARQRQRWLEAAKVNLELIYASDDEDEEDEKSAAEPSLERHFRRAAAAHLAIALRCSGVSLSARARPPLMPPQPAQRGSAERLTTCPGSGSLTPGSILSDGSRTATAPAGPSSAVHADE